MTPGIFGMWECQSLYPGKGRKVRQPRLGELSHFTLCLFTAALHACNVACVAAVADCSFAAHTRSELQDQASSELHCRCTGNSSSLADLA